MTIPRSTQHSVRRSAFTLVELLVVVTVISVLIALLLPAMKRARTAALETLCMANMGQVTSATFSYANQNRGQFPANRVQPEIQTQHVTWRWLLNENEFIGDGDIWLCPERTESRTEQNINAHGSICIGDIESNYAYNGAAFWRFSPLGAPDGSDQNRYAMPTGKSHLTLQNIRTPEQTFLLLESRGHWPDIGDWAVGWTNWPDGAGPIAHWHRRGSNWAMANGSVQWSRLYDTGNPKCWWHNIDEGDNAHANWQFTLPAHYW